MLLLFWVTAPALEVDVCVVECVVVSRDCVLELELLVRVSVSELLAPCVSSWSEADNASVNEDVIDVNDAGSGSDVCRANGFEGIVDDDDNNPKEEDNTCCCCCCRCCCCCCFLGLDSSLLTTVFLSVVFIPLMILLVLVLILLVKSSTLLGADGKSVTPEAEEEGGIVNNLLELSPVIPHTEPLSRPEEDCDDHTECAPPVKDMKNDEKSIKTNFI